MRVPSSYRRLIALMLAVFIAHLDANLSGPAMYLLEVKTGSPASEVSSLTSLYLGAEVCGLIAGGAWFLHRDTAVAARWAMWITALSLVASAIIDNLVALNVIRVVQGASAGLLVVAFLVDIKRHANAGHVAHFVAGNSAATLVAAIAAPVMAAMLPLERGGDWLFWIPVPLILFAIAITPRLPMQKKEPAPQMPFASYVNIAWLFPPLVIAMWALEKERGTIDDTALSWWTMTTVSACCLLGFFLSRQQLRPEQRFLLLPSISEARNLYFALPVAFLSGATIFGGTYLLSFQLIKVHHAGPDVLLVLTLLMAVPQLVMLPIFVRATKCVSPFLLIAIGATLCAVSFFIMTDMTKGTHAPDLHLTQALRVVGIPLIAMPLTMMVVNTTPAAYMSTATSLLSVSRMLGGSIGVALPLWYVFRREEQWHHEISIMTPAWSASQIDPNAIFVWALMECNFIWGLASLLIGLASFLLVINAKAWSK